MATRESFLVYGSWEEPIMNLSTESKGMLFTAILHYHNTGEILGLPMDARMAFAFIKKQMDMDADKYEKTCEKRSAAGAKGALKKSRNAKQTKDCLANQANASFAKQNKQKQANQADNDNDNENDNDVCEHTARVRACENHPQNRNDFAGPGSTHTQIENIHQRLKNKFYVPSKTDAECMNALRQMRSMSNNDVVAAAHGEPVDITVSGVEIWRTGCRELDMAAGRRVWDERLLKKYENANKGVVNA